MLTVDYDRLGLQAGERLLDMGAGGGRHAFECLRRGAHVTAFDLEDANEALAALARGQFAGSGVLRTGGRDAAMRE